MYHPPAFPHRKDWANVQIQPVYTFLVQRVRILGGPDLARKFQFYRNDFRGELELCEGN